MLTEMTLTTEKYVRQSMNQEQKQGRRERNRKALRDFRTFLLGLVAIGFGVYAAQLIPVWTPIVKAHMASLWGI